MTLALVWWVRRARELHPTPVFAWQSARRWAASQLGISRRRQFAEDHRTALRSGIRITLAAIVLALAFVPGWEIRFGPFKDEADSREYLQTLWQVLAAAVGVSVAVIAFVLQAFLTSGERRHGGTLREFANQTGVLTLFDLAAISLCIDGLALAGVGGVAPAGWPGLFAAVLSGATLIVLLVVVPRSILRALDPMRLVNLRMESARDIVRGAVRAQLISQLATSRLMQYAELTGVRRALVADDGQAIVSARRTGVVHDIRFGMLYRAVRPLSPTKGRPVNVLVDINNQVFDETPMLGVPAGTSSRRRAGVRRSLRVRRRRADEPTSAIVAVIDRLRQQALVAVRQGDEVEWREFATVIEDVTLEHPRTTHALGLTFEGAVSSPGLFGYGPTDRIADLLRSVIDEMVDRGTESLAGAVLYTPLRIASEAMELDAPAIVRGMARIYVAAYRIARRKRSEAALAQFVAAEAIDQLFELVERVGGHDLAFSIDERKLEIAQSYVRVGLSGVQELLKPVLRDADSDALTKVFHRLAGLVENWEDWGDGPRARRQQELLQDITTMRLALISWAVFLLADSRRPDRSAWLQDAIVRLAEASPPNELVAGFQRLSDRERSLGVEVAWWFYDDEVAGVQSLDLAGKLAPALILALAVHEASFPSGEWIGTRYEGLAAAADHISANPERFAPVLGINADDNAGLRARIADVRSELARLHAEQESAEAAQTRAAALDATQVDAFVAAANEAVDGMRLVRDMLKTLGRWTLVSDPKGWEQDTVLLTWTDKRFYTGAPRFVGQEMIAGQLGRRAGLHEMRDLVALYSQIKPAQPQPNVREQIEAAIDSMRDAGHEPSLIVLPVSGSLLEALDLLFPNAGIIERTIAPATHRQRFKGEIKGVAATAHPALTDRVLVIDLASVGMYERPTPRGTGVEARVRAFDEAAARKLLAEHPEVFPEESDEQTKLELIQGRVRLEIALAWRLVSDDPAAIRVIGVPEPLRHKKARPTGEDRSDD